MTKQTGATEPVNFLALELEVMDTELLSLNCLVLGEDEYRVFTIKIPKTDNVSILKDLIKERKAHHFNHVDASDLELWNVSFLIDKLASEKPSTDGGKLRSTKKLSSLTSPLLDDHVHILVKAPGASLVSSFLDPIL